MPVKHASSLLNIGWAVVLAFLFVLAVDSFVAPPGAEGDSAVFVYVAQGILQGEVPYLDRWDHKGPLIYLINVIGLAISQLWGVWAIQTLFLSGSAFAAFTLLRKAFGYLPAFFSLAIFLTYFSRFGSPGNYVEQYNLLFQLLALYLFMRSEEEPQTAPKGSRFALLHLAIGALGAAAFLLRQNLVALWVVIGLYWLIRRGASLRKLAWAVVGGGGVLLVVAGLFAGLGAWGALWDAVFLFNFAYSDASLQDRIGLVGGLIDLLFPVVLLAVFGWCLGLSQQVRKGMEKGRRGSLVAICMPLLPLEALSLSLSGVGHRHYYVTALSVLAILVAYPLWYALKRRPAASLALSFALLAAAVYYAAPTATIPFLAEKYISADSAPGTIKHPQAARLRDLIQAGTSESDTILVWGRGAWIYLIAERDAASRFFYDAPLTMPNYTNAAIHEEFLSAVTRREPRLIVQVDNTRVPPVASAQRSEWRQFPRFAYDSERFQPFFRFVEENYLLADETPYFTIYALRRSDDVPPVNPPEQLIVQSVYSVYLDGKTLTYVKSRCDGNDAVKRFILHVIPVDSSVIGGRGQDTLDFSFLEGDDWHIGEGCVVSRMLPEYPIAAIRTGQYNAAGTAHDWLSEYRWPQAR